MFERYPHDGALEEALQQMLKASPWYTLAMILMLTPEQWQRLRSQEVFQALRVHLERIAAAALCGRKDCYDSAGDVAQSVLSRLAGTNWLKRFIASRGSPAGYARGASRFQTRDVIRSLLRVKNRRLAGLPNDVVASVGDFGNEVEQAELIGRVKELVARVPKEFRDALLRAHPILGEADASSADPATKGERARCADAITMLRRMLGLR